MGLDIKELLPPGDPMTRWRFVMVGILIALLLNSAAGRGVFGGVLQYASAAETRQNSVKIDRILKLQIAQTLRDLREQECRANGNIRLIQDTIEDYQEEYKNLNQGKRYPLPSCDE